MKNKSKPQERERKYFLSEFSYFDGEYDVTFNIVDVDFNRQAITVAISRCGKITQDTFGLLGDKNGRLYFEYGVMFDRVYLDEFEEAA